MSNYYRKIFSPKTRNKISEVADTIVYFQRAYFSSDQKVREETKEFLKNRRKKRMFRFRHRTLHFFVIRRTSEIEGHCSMMNTFLGHLYESDQKGMIPVIDMKHYYSGIWQSPLYKGKENAWEYYYQQPCGYDLKSLFLAKNVTYCQGYNSQYNPWNNTSLIDRDTIEKYKKIYDRYVIFNAPVRDFIEKQIDRLGVKTRRILGVSIRRGIEWGHMVDHPWYTGYKKIFSLQDYIVLCENLMQKWNCPYLFVTIDDQEGIAILIDHFKDKLLFLDRERPCYFKNGDPIPKDERKKSKPDLTKEYYYHKELNYLTEVYLLAQCTCLIATPTSANTTAMIINGNKYEHIYEEQQHGSTIK